jgi:replicative DNA helicase
MSQSHKWRSNKIILKEGISYMFDRMIGQSPIFDTGFPSINDANAGGLEVGTTFVIAARPGTCKTALKDQIIRNVITYNEDKEFYILDVQMELSKQAAGVRQVSSMTNRPYKELISGDTPFSEEDYEECRKAANAHLNSFKNHHVLYEEITVKEFEMTVIQYMESYKKRVMKKVRKGSITTDEEVYSFIPTLITIDHSLLFLKGDRSEQDLLDELFRTLTKLKRIYPIAFVVLHQLNRDIETMYRTQPGSFGNYPKSTDLRGSDVVLHHSDCILAFNNPFNLGITEYGPGLLRMSEGVLPGHYLKSRNNFKRVSLYYLEGSNYSLKEVKPEELEKVYRESSANNGDAGSAIQTV